jgi:DegV family protein with EDD domain
MRIALTTDSGCGLEREEMTRMGVHVVPMPFMFDNDPETYFEGINMSADDFFRRMEDGGRCRTSQPLPEDVFRTWDAALTEADAVIHLPISSALSGSAQQALLLSREEKYRGRVFVADNHRVSITQQQALLDACNLIRKGYGPGEIVKVLQENADENAIYIAMGTLEYLKRGGRITPAAAAIGTFLKIRPVLSIPAGGALDTYRTGRTAKQCRQIMLEALRRDARERFHDPSCRHCDLAVAYSDDRESAEVFARELGEAFPEKRGEIAVRRLSLLLSCHIGPGAVGAAIMPRLKAAAAATSAVA